MITETDFHKKLNTTLFTLRISDKGNSLNYISIFKLQTRLQQSLAEKLIQKTELSSRFLTKKPWLEEEMAVSNLDEFTWVVHCLISQCLKNRLTRELSKNIIKV